jgi:ParB-like chromosome segregation protein Spo0J
MDKTEAAPLQMRDLATRTDMYKVDPRIIVIQNKHNPRTYKLEQNRQHLDGLKASIASEGVLNPITCRKDGDQIILVDGECRLRSCLELIKEFEEGKGGADIKTIPAIMTKVTEPAELLLIAFTANMGKPFAKWEAGIGFKRFIKYGWTEEQIAVRTGYTERFIKEALELEDAPAEMKALLSEQAITPAYAIKKLRTVGPSKAVAEAVAAVAAKRESGAKGAVKAEKKADTPKEPKEPKESGKYADIATSIVAAALDDGDFGTKVLAEALEVKPKALPEFFSVSSKHMLAMLKQLAADGLIK